MPQACSAKPDADQSEIESEDEQDAEGQRVSKFSQSKAVKNQRLLLIQIEEKFLSVQGDGRGQSAAGERPREASCPGYPSIRAGEGSMSFERRELQKELLLLICPEVDETVWGIAGEHTRQSHRHFVIGHSFSGTGIE